MNIRSRARNSATSGSTSGLNREASVGERARLAFNVYDRNRDGYLTKSELRRTSKRMTEAQVMMESNSGGTRMHRTFVL